MDFKIKIKETFDIISDKYDKIRRQPWADLIHFMEDHQFFNDCDIVLDIGCGNGRHTDIMSNYCNFSIGLELSNELLKIAKITYKKMNSFYINSDAVHLPFRNNIFSKIIYIATLHHIPTEEQREQSLLEIKRILGPKGQAIITVWRRYQEKFFLIFFIDLLFLNFKRRRLEYGDIFIPWRGQNKEIIANRFYHLFTLKEMKKILEKVGLKILEIKFFSGKSGTANVIAFIEKIE